MVWDHAQERGIDAARFVCRCGISDKEAHNNSHTLMHGLNRTTPFSTTAASTSPSPAEPHTSNSLVHTFYTQHWPARTRPHTTSLYRQTHSPCPADRVTIDWPRAFCDGGRRRRRSSVDSAHTPRAHTHTLVSNHRSDTHTVFHPKKKRTCLSARKSSLAFYAFGVRFWMIFFCPSVRPTTIRSAGAPLERTFSSCCCCWWW